MPAIPVEALYLTPGATDIFAHTFINHYTGGIFDAFGANVYRGPSARDLFDKVKKTLGPPVMFTEFGADAFDARRGQEDHVAQADYLRSQWEEIYEQSHGKGLAGNAIGGFIFQWDDGWWKVGQETNLDVHDTKATWPNEGYGKDFSPGDNNMNEEWFGLVSKDRPDADGFYHLAELGWTFDKVD